MTAQIETIVTQYVENNEYSHSEREHVVHIDGEHLFNTKAHLNDLKWYLQDKGCEINRKTTQRKIQL